MVMPLKKCRPWRGVVGQALPAKKQPSGIIKQGIYHTSSTRRNTRGTKWWAMPTLVF